MAIRREEKNYTVISSGHCFPSTSMSCVASCEYLHRAPSRKKYLKIKICSLDFSIDVDDYLAEIAREYGISFTASSASNLNEWLRASIYS